MFLADKGCVGTALEFCRSTDFIVMLLKLPSLKLLVNIPNDFKDFKAFFYQLNALSELFCKED
jgi:hypothetical protein